MRSKKKKEDANKEDSATWFMECAIWITSCLWSYHVNIVIHRKAGEGCWVGWTYPGFTVKEENRKKYEGLSKKL